MPETRKDTAFWLLGDPESLKFWPDSAETDEDGRSIPACPDVTGKMPQLNSRNRNNLLPRDD